MRNDRVLRYAALGALALVLVLLVLVLFQVHGLEKRFIAQGQQLRALGEATDRLAAGGVRLSQGSQAPAADEVPPGVKLLHPEVENFLKPADTRWPAPGASRDGVLARGWEHGDPKGFNSLLENSADLVELIEEYTALGLARRNVWSDPNIYHGELAWRIEITNDYKEFTAYLRPGIAWHTPSGVDLNDAKYAWLRGKHEVTAHDLVFTLELILNPQVESGPARNYYAEVESYRAVDDHTFVVRWKKKQYTNLAFSVELAPWPRFLYAFDESGKPLPKETLGLRFNQHWYNNKGYVGAGPYRMTSYVPGSKITLERNESFPGDKPAIKSFIYPIYNDTSQTALKLKAHEIGAGELMAGQYRTEIQQYESSGQKPKNSPFFDGRIQCEKVQRPAFSYVGWNAERPFFADKRVRRAMTHAFDRAKILENVYLGLGTVTTSPYLPGSPYADPEVKALPFDLAAARQLLAEAGWTDTDGDGLLDKQVQPGDAKRSNFEFTLLFGGGVKEIEATAKIYREDLLKLGVKMNLDAAEWSLMQKRMDEKRFDALMAAWMLPWEPDLYQVWHSSQANIPKGSNRISFRNPEADKIIESLRITFDKAERIQLLRRFHRLLAEEQPYSFFTARKKVYCVWNDVKNVIWSKVFPIENTFPWWVASAAP